MVCPQGGREHTLYTTKTTGLVFSYREIKERKKIQEEEKSLDEQLFSVRG